MPGSIPGPSTINKRGVHMLHIQTLEAIRERLGTEITSIEDTVTGILVRAMKEGGGWGSYDIAFLNSNSLEFWLEQYPTRATEVTLILLNHGR